MSCCDTNLVPTAPLTDFTPMVLASIYGLPPAVAEAHVRNAAIEFARRTDMLKRTAFVNFGTGQDHQIVELCDDSIRLHAIEDVYHPVCQRKLTPVRCVTDLRYTPTSYYFEKPCDLWICPPMDCPGTVELRVVVVPSVTACRLDECLLDEHANTIAEYATGMALNMPDASWYSPDAWIIRRRAFEERVAEARTDTERGQMKGPLVARQRRFV